MAGTVPGSSRNAHTVSDDTLQGRPCHLKLTQKAQLLWTELTRGTQVSLKMPPEGLLAFPGVRCTIKSPWQMPRHSHRRMRPDDMHPWGTGGSSPSESPVPSSDCFKGRTRHLTRFAHLCHHGTHPKRSAFQGARISLCSSFCGTNVIVT